MSRPGEYIEGHETENIELKERWRQEKEEADEQYDTPNRFDPERDDFVDAREQLDEQETDFGGGQDPDKDTERSEPDIDLDELLNVVYARKEFSVLFMPL